MACAVGRQPPDPRQAESTDGKTMEQGWSRPYYTTVFTTQASFDEPCYLCVSWASKLKMCHSFRPSGYNIVSLFCFWASMAQ